MVHGGGGQATDWMSTPDGRPGWRTLLLRRGYAVHLVDRPGHGRSPRTFAEWAAADTGGMVPSVEGLGPLFAGHGNPAQTQWPGPAAPGDPALAQLLASQRQPGYDVRAHHEVMAQRGAELLDAIGSAIVVTSSAGGPTGWLMADRRPGLVRAIVALEPLGPSGPVPFAWGLADAPLSYDPPAPTAADLALVTVAGADGAPEERRQPEPPRRLTHLVDVPIAIVTGAASFAGPMDRATVAYLHQAGCRRVQHLALDELGVEGNGHLMMVERNNEEVLDVVTGWLQRRLTPSSTGRADRVS